MRLPFHVFVTNLEYFDIQSKCSPFFNCLTLSSPLKWWQISCTIQFHSHVPYIWNSHELDRWKESATVERDGRTEYKGGSRERGGVWQIISSKLNWRKDVWWLDVQRSEGQVYPTCKDQFSFLGNRAWYYSWKNRSKLFWGISDLGNTIHGVGNE